MTSLLDLSPALWQALFLTLGLATCTTLILLVICIPLANWLNTRQGQWVLLLETLLTLPIVLPPTVIGFYLLLAMSPNTESATGGTRMLASPCRSLSWAWLWAL